MNVAEVLAGAADLIEPEGAWGQGFWGLSEGARCHCAVGAIGRVAGCRFVEAAEDWVDEHASLFLRMNAQNLEGWNDAPERTQAEVVAKLREAAERARLTDTDLAKHSADHARFNRGEGR